MKPLEQFATPEPIMCAVCIGRAMHLGYAPKSASKFLWCCGDAGCIPHLRRIYTMPEIKYDAYELGAQQEAGNAAGQLLDDLGKTDLAELTPEEWQRFVRMMFATYKKSMRRKLENDEAPF